MPQQMVIVMDAQPGPKALRRIEEHIRDNKCLCGCGRTMWRRGRCRICHYAWEKDLEALPDEPSRAAHTAKLVRNGLLLLAYWTRKFKRLQARKNLRDIAV